MLHGKWHQVGRAWRRGFRRRQEAPRYTHPLAVYVPGIWCKVISDSVTEMIILNDLATERK